MATMRLIPKRLCAPAVLAAALWAGGCAAPVLALAVWAGKVMLYTAAVKLTVQMVDSVLGTKTKDPNTEFVADPANPDRGSYRSLTFQKKDGRGQPVGKPIVLVDVPVYRGSDGQFHIDRDYLNKVDDAIKRAERE